MKILCSLLDNSRKIQTIEPPHVIRFMLYKEFKVFRAWSKHESIKITSPVNVFEKVLQNIKLQRQLYFATIMTQLLYL